MHETLHLSVKTTVPWAMTYKVPDTQRYLSQLSNPRVTLQPDKELTIPTDLPKHLTCIMTILECVCVVRDNICASSQSIHTVRRC